MEKKNLGRGLEEISNIFLSTSKEKEEKNAVSGFSAVAVREETCASCVNMIEGSSKEPKCRIFTFESKRYGVPHLDTITLNHANYCEYFEPITSGDTDRKKEAKGDYSDQAEDNCEVEETVTVQKKIAYPNTETGQQDMRKALFKHLEAGYTIRAIELGKMDEFSGPKRKETRKEEISIFVKKPEEKPET